MTADPTLESRFATRQEITAQGQKIINRTRMLIDSLEDAGSVTGGLSIITAFIVEIAPMIREYNNISEEYLNQMLKPVTPPEASLEPDHDDG